MKIFELLQNKFIKTIGIGLIIYFALFANKEKPQSLGNRLSTEKLKKNFSEIEERSKFIITNVKAAQDYSKAKKLTMVSIEDIENGTQEEQVTCGDEVEISYGIYNDKEGKQTNFFDSKKFIIGNKTNTAIEQNIIGMRKGGMRNINIPHEFQTDDPDLLKVLQSDTTAKYQVTILNIKKSTNSTNFCD